MSWTAEDLLARHRSGLSDFQPFPLFSELAPVGKLPRFLIITCADPRCVPERIFKIQPGEVPPVAIRVPGGNAESALNPLLALDTLLHFTDCFVVHHTDCGATVFKDANIKEELKTRAPDKATEIEGLKFGQLSENNEENVKKSVNFLQTSPLVRKELKANIRGFVFDIRSGDLKEVSP